METEDAPEADVIEQREPVTEPIPPETPRIGIEVPEADAIEQAQPAPLDEEEQR